MKCKTNKMQNNYRIGETWNDKINKIKIKANMQERYDCTSNISIQSSCGYWFGTALSLFEKQ